LLQIFNVGEKRICTFEAIITKRNFFGAMVREAEHSESKPDFVHKMAIAQKEINESLYWLELLYATDYLSLDLFNSLNNDAVEIIKLITSSIKTAKSTINH